MLQQPSYSILVRLILEAFIMLNSICVLTNTKFQVGRALKWSIVICITVFIARLLPVHFGVHTIISIIIYIILSVKLFSIDIYRSIATVLIIHIVLFVSDLLLVMIYTKLLQLPAELVMSKTWVANVAGIPSLFIFYLIIKIIHYFKKKKANYEQHYKSKSVMGFAKVARNIISTS